MKIYIVVSVMDYTSAHAFFSIHIFKIENGQHYNQGPGRAPGSLPLQSVLMALHVPIHHAMTRPRGMRH
jgi:hypothetical protein